MPPVVGKGFKLKRLGHSTWRCEPSEASIRWATSEAHDRDREDGTKTWLISSQLSRTVF
jgi:hypothetical protein